MRDTGQRNLQTCAVRQVTVRQAALRAAAAPCPTPDGADSRADESATRLDW